MRDLRAQPSEDGIKPVSASVLAALALASAPAALAAGPAATPSYSASFGVPVNVLVGCYMGGRTLMTATPTGNGFAVRRKGETSTLLLTEGGVRSRAELYKAADGPSHAMRQVLRACDRRALASTGSF